MTPATPPPSGTAVAPSGHPRKLLALMTGLFFAFGFCTVLVDTLIPRLKAIFQLTYTEVMLTQFCYFVAYAVVSGPAGWLIGRIGYLRAVTVGLLVMTAGCALFTPAARLASYPAFLGALFVLASGVTVVQVAANPLTARLGDPDGAPSRLTLAQAFNSVATMVGPLFGSAFLLAHAVAVPSEGSLPPAALVAARAQAAQSLTPPYLAIAAGLGVLALVCWFARRWSPASVAQQGGSYRHLLGRRRLMLGALSIFAYVGAEVSIGSALINYLMQDQVIGGRLGGLGQVISHDFGGGRPVSGAQAAADLVSLYWGGAMVGRFVGAAVLRRLPAGLVLAGCAAVAAALAVVSGVSGGLWAAIAILAVGLFNSIQFPTIFTLAIEGLGEDTPEGSGLLCVAIVGGALVPLATGYAADRLGLSFALVVPAVCYVWVAAYGLLCRRPALAPAARFWPALGWSS
jgi:FHS family L-fucose permease-like MFS transporter